VAVYYGDFALPDASATQYVRRGRQILAKDPQGALALARQAVAASPRGFDANRFLGDALVAGGDPADAVSAYQVVMQRVAEMEPDARKKWEPGVKKSIDTAFHGAEKQGAEKR